MYRYFYRFRLLPCHLFFPIFHFFCIVGGIGCRGVFFLWFFGVGSVDGFRPVYRFAPRLAFPVSPFSPSFAPPFRFVCSFWRIVEAVRAAVFGAWRLACRLVWRDDGVFVVCAVFVSSCSWVLEVVSGFPFSPFDVSSVLLVSAGREVRCLSCECRSGRMRLRRGAVPCCRPVCVFLIGVPCRLVFSRRCHSRRCRRSFSCSSRRACRVAACLASGRWSVAAWRLGVALCCRCVGSSVWCGGGRFGDAVSCGVVCRERDEGRDEWRDEGRDGGCAVFVSSSWRFIGRWRRRGWMRAGGVPWAWVVSSACLFFFFLASRIE